MAVLWHSNYCSDCSADSANQSIEGEAKVITTLHPEAVPFLYGGFKDVFLFTPIEMRNVFSSALKVKINTDH